MCVCCCSVRFSQPHKAKRMASLCVSAQSKDDLYITLRDSTHIECATFAAPLVDNGASVLVFGDRAGGLWRCFVKDDKTQSNDGEIVDDAISSVDSTRLLFLQQKQLNCNVFVNTRLHVRLLLLCTTLFSPDAKTAAFGELTPLEVIQSP